MTEANDRNAPVMKEFRANGGRVGGPLEGTPMLILHSTGAKTGEERVNPLRYLAVGGVYAVFASAQGVPRHPAWFHNLVAHPDPSIEVGSEVVDVTARVTAGEEREALWTRAKEQFSNLVEVEQMTTRQIPAVVLEPRR